jgi:hypothetical protein
LWFTSRSARSGVSDLQRSVPPRASHGKRDARALNVEE